jgi:hypothetical protein
MPAQRDTAVGALIALVGWLTLPLSSVHLSSCVDLKKLRSHGVGRAEGKFGIHARESTRLLQFNTLSRTLYYIGPSSDEVVVLSVK